MILKRNLSLEKVMELQLISDDKLGLILKIK